MILRQLKFVGLLFLAGVTLSVVYNVVGPRGHAAALHGSVILSTGEWTASGGASGMAIPASVNTATEFKTFINGLLHNTAESGDPGSDYNKYGAAFLVENMIHGKTEYSANAALVTAALNDYTKWAGYVDDYSAAGRINWSLSKTVAAGNYNSTHLCIEGSGGYCWARATYYDNNYNSGGYDGKHFDYYTLSDDEPSTLIIFTNPNGTTFQIRRECGNVIGSAGPLVDLGWNLNGRTTATKTSIYAGGYFDFDSQLQNTGASAATTTWTVTWCYDACTSWTTHASGSDTIPKGGAWVDENPWPWPVSPSNPHTKVCARISYTNGSGPGTATETATPVCVTIIPLQSTCAGVVVNPALIGTNDSYSVSATVTTSGGTAEAQDISDTSNFYITVNGPNVSINNTDVTPVTVGAGTLAASINPPPTGESGNYTVTYGITGAAGAVDCTGSFSVVYRPYFSVLGGDVTAGSGFGSSCSGTAATINSWNSNTSTTPNYYGSGTEIAAWATSGITNFVSGIGLSGGAASNSGYGLSLSNTVGVGGAGHGGNFGANAVPCMYDYYGNKPGTTASVGTTNLTAMTLGSGDYTAPVDGSGTFTLGGSGDITVAQDAAGNGKQISIYVAGNLYIKSNIKYSYANINQIPRLNLYVQGNIYIDPNVTEIHGVYMAQKSSSGGGTINTCNPGTVAAPQPYATCNKQLKIVGAMAADVKIRLVRTYGNLSATPGAPAEPAEIFQYSPELWMAQTVTPGFNYQSYSNLAPIL